MPQILQYYNIARDSIAILVSQYSYIVSRLKFVCICVIALINSTCDIEPSDMRNKISDTTLALLKIDIQPRHTT